MLAEPPNLPRMRAVRLAFSGPVKAEPTMQVTEMADATVISELWWARST
jgi:hypothetical protein